jgi:hypothetical protein
VQLILIRWCLSQAATRKPATQVKGPRTTAGTRHDRSVVNAMRAMPDRDRVAGGGQFAHPHPPVRSLGQVLQCHVLAQRQVLLADEVGVGQPGQHDHHPDPGRGSPLPHPAVSGFIQRSAARGSKVPRRPKGASKSDRTHAARPT